MPCSRSFLSQSAEKLCECRWTIWHHCPCHRRLLGPLPGGSTRPVLTSETQSTPTALRPSGVFHVVLRPSWHPARAPLPRRSDALLEGILPGPCLAFAGGRARGGRHLCRAQPSGTRAACWRLRLRRGHAPECFSSKYVATKPMVLSGVTGMGINRIR